ncbi:hypothetical protein [Salininema proteolyticum]|uniref:Poly(3-hydroxyalkanoate) polymerase subunit PhaE n=1 Tax=Salininema proteolyticum TaxID=1607685 RepID=A0ABV8TUQ4_9ACTN
MIRASSGDYTRWKEWLEGFGRGVDRGTDGLPPFHSDWGGGMYERLLDRVESAFTARMGLWAESLQRDMGRASGLTADELGAALTAARRRLRPIKRFAESDRLPEDLRTQLATALHASVATAQRSLERSAGEDDPTGHRAAVVRRGPLTADLGTRTPERRDTPNPPDTGPRPIRFR